MVRISRRLLKPPGSSPTRRGFTSRSIHSRRGSIGRQRTAMSSSGDGSLSTLMELRATSPSVLQRVKKWLATKLPGASLITSQSIYTGHPRLLVTRETDGTFSIVLTFPVTSSLNKSLEVASWSLVSASTLMKLESIEPSTTPAESQSSPEAGHARDQTQPNVPTD